VLSAVAEKTGNTVILLIRDGIYLRSILKVLNPESIVMQEIGVRNEDPCGTPWGAIQLVEFGLEEGKGPEWMAGRYPQASTYPEPWVREYRQRGWVLDDGERFKGVRRIAVPVFDESRKLMGVLALGGTLGSIPAEKVEPFSGILSRYAAVLRDAWKDIL
jgi:DNA-binding IclR family transcriptional regulator